MSSQRSGVLELAVLGLLHETPMHGYELRKRLNTVLGAFRAFGYGSLYPCLKELLAQGMIAEEEAPPAALTRTRARVDRNTLELQRHGLGSVEREVRWLNELIASGRQSDAGPRS